MILGEAATFLARPWWIPRDRTSRIIDQRAIPAEKHIVVGLSVCSALRDIFGSNLVCKPSDDDTRAKGQRVRAGLRTL